MRTTVRRSGLWAVYRWYGKRRVRVFAGCASRCFRWAEQKANAIERKTNLRPFLYVKAVKPYRIHLVRVAV